MRDKDMPMLVSMKRISTVIGLLALAVPAAPALADGPGRNQATADAVAGTLRTSAALANSPVQIEAREGLVTLSGTVASPALKAEAVARTRNVPGVTGVIDRLRVAGDGRVLPAQYEPQQLAMGFHHGRHGHGGGMIGGGGVIDGGMSGEEAIADGGLGGPVPEGPAIPGASQASSPAYPNYAWPSYAPYPNFSAVGYPTVYPWQAWPNIGPFYPYPEVPLDWRAVTLRWDDGLWWLDFKKHYTRPFFTPYPFGIFGY
jgi:hypothetical protein